MNNDPDIERSVRRSLEERSARLDRVAPVGLDRIRARVDERRARRRSVAALGSVALIGVGAVGLLSIQGARTVPSAGGVGPTEPAVPERQAAWRCTDQLDLWDDAAGAVYFVACEQVAIDGNIPIIPPLGEIVTATTEPVDEIRYVIEQGDTFDSIAAKFATTPQAIADLNHWNDMTAQRLKPGNQILVLLVPITIPDTVPFEQQYVIVVGDSINAIAANFGITMEQLVNYNSWDDGLNHLLVPGAVIMIPPDARIQDGS